MEKHFPASENCINIGWWFLHHSVLIFDDGKSYSPGYRVKSSSIKTSTELLPYILYESQNGLGLKNNFVPTLLSLGFSWAAEKITVVKQFSLWSANMKELQQCQILKFSPLTHVPKYHILMSFKFLQGWWLHYFHEYPVTFDNPLSEEIFPNIQLKPPLVQLEATSSYPVICYLGEVLQKPRPHWEGDSGDLWNSCWMLSSEMQWNRSAWSDTMVQT